MTNISITSDSNDQNDEMDLVEFIASLWHEKAVIIVTTTILTVLGAIYTFTRTPLYEATTQLLAPSSTELAYLNQTNYFSITPNSIFSDFFEVLVNDSHINQLAIENPEILNDALGVEANEDAINSVLDVRNVKYPITSKKENSIRPDNYYLSYTGINRNALQKLITQDIEQAQTQVLKKVHERYKTTLEQKIGLLSGEQELSLMKLDDQLTSRKSYVISSRKDRLRQLGEALKIAKTLNIQSPTSITKLATSASNHSKQVEINAELNSNQDPLYLRGSKLLIAEIENLRALEDDVFLDNQIRKLEANRIMITNNRELEQLKNSLESFKEKSNITFYSGIINTPSKPAAPKKTRTIVISALLGCILGIFIAIVRRLCKNYCKSKATANVA